MASNELYIGHKLNSLLLSHKLKKLSAIYCISATKNSEAHLNSLCMTT